MSVLSVSSTSPDEVALKNIERFLVNTYGKKQLIKQTILTPSLH